MAKNWMKEQFPEYFNKEDNKKFDWMRDKFGTLGDMLTGNGEWSFYMDKNSNAPFAEFGGQPTYTFTRAQDMGLTSAPPEVYNRPDYRGLAPGDTLPQPQSEPEMAFNARKMDVTKEGLPPKEGGKEEVRGGYTGPGVMDGFEYSARPTVDMNDYGLGGMEYVNMAEGNYLGMPQSTGMLGQGMTASDRVADIANRPAGDVFGINPLLGAALGAGGGYLLARNMGNAPVAPTAPAPSNATMAGPTREDARVARMNEAVAARQAAATAATSEQYKPNIRGPRATINTPLSVLNAPGMFMQYQDFMDQAEKEKQMYDRAIYGFSPGDVY